MCKMIAGLLVALALEVQAYIIFFILLKIYSFNSINPIDNISPAIDIILIYHFSGDSKIQYWVLFIIGMVIDQVYGMPSGSNSLIFMILNLFLSYSSYWFNLRDKFMSILAFGFYNFLIICSRCIVFIIKNNYAPKGFEVLKYYLVTFLFYLVLKFLIRKPSMLYTKYVK